MLRLSKSFYSKLLSNSSCDSPRLLVSIVGSLRDREVTCSASDRQGSNFESCVWRTVSSQSSHHPQEVLLAQFSLYVHKGGLKPDSFHFISPRLFVSHGSNILNKIFKQNYYTNCRIVMSCIMLNNKPRSFKMTAL